MRPSLLLPALLLVVCAVSLGWWLLGGDAGAGGTATPATAPADAAPDPVIHLVILNGTPQRDLAGESGLLLSRLGCVVDRVGNAPHDGFARSLLVNRRLPAERARRLADQLGGVDLILEHDPRSPEDAVLVLGADHANVNAALERATDQ